MVETEDGTDVRGEGKNRQNAKYFPDPQELLGSKVVVV